jgi:hypothetical protein
VTGAGGGWIYAKIVHVIGRIFDLGEYLYIFMRLWMGRF